MRQVGLGQFPDLSFRSEKAHGWEYLNMQKVIVAVCLLGVFQLQALCVWAIEANQRRLKALNEVIGILKVRSEQEDSPHVSPKKSAGRRT
jgi:hypothetical protein